MAKFQVVQKDPTQYKQQILQFWKDYMPETPPERFEWMNHGNPAGPSIWFLAFEEGSNEIAGTISIMPRELSFRGQTIRAGILGDFMVSSKYRVFGPALQMLKTVTKHLSNLNFNLFYTIPNYDSIKIIQRAGFKHSKVLNHLVKPVNLQYYLEKYMNPFSARLSAPFINQGLRFFSKEIYTSSGGVLTETSEIDSSFNLLWDKIKKTQSVISGDLSSPYLNWRYFQNPLCKFRVLTYKKHPQGDLLGYIFFTTYDNKLEIFDIISLNISYANKLLKKLIQISREEKRMAIYIRVLETNPYLNTLKSFTFFDSKDDALVLFFGQELPPKEWSFFSGDRNI